MLLTQEGIERCGVFEVSNIITECFAQVHVWLDLMKNAKLAAWWMALLLGATHSSVEGVLVELHQAFVFIFSQKLDTTHR